MQISRNKFNSFIDPTKFIINKKTSNDLKFLFKNYINHKFDILGSGSVQVKYNLIPNGLEGYKYHNNKKIFQYKYFFLLGILKKFNLVSKNYIPIPWNIDFKSGFQFRSNSLKLKNFYDSYIGRHLGADIKVPWEFGRLYHLPQIAIYAFSAPERDVKYKSILEFKNEVLDFITNNPYKKTVQWSSAMEVSIRAVNLLVAYDILKQIDSDGLINYKFDKIFYKFIKKHGNYIINNLEYSGKISSNHYLSNLAGLIFISAYLKSDNLIDAWLVFATQELIEQVKVQFNSDGSHFECSTSYHRLCLEFVLYSTLIILRVIQTSRKKAYIEYNCRLVNRLKPFKNQKYNLKSCEFFPKYYIDTILLAGLFTKNIMNNKSEIIQVGDNDSGRLLKLTPIGNIITSIEAKKKYFNINKIEDKYYFDENIVNHSSILSLESGLFEKDIGFKKYRFDFSLEYSLAKSIIGNKIFERKLDIKNTISFYKLQDIKLDYKNTTKFSFLNLKQSLSRNINFYNYNNFGICLFKSNMLYLAIVVDTTKYAKFCGHSHNDKLSFELIVENKPIVRDAGGYIYAPLPKRRDVFRSIKSHNTIIIGNSEQNDFLGTFNLNNRARGYIIEKQDCYIKLYSEYKGIKHIREISILDYDIIINDYCNYEFIVNLNDNLYSNGYGKILREEWLKNKYKAYTKTDLEKFKNIIIY